MKRSGKVEPAVDWMQALAARNGSDLRIAVLAEAAVLDEVFPEVRRLRGSGPSRVLILVPVARFRAPAGTPLPYRSLARRTARDINECRARQAQEDVAKRVEALGPPSGWQVEDRVVFDPTPESLATLIADLDVDLVVFSAKTDTGGTSNLPRGLAAKLSRLVRCPLLVVPDAAHASEPPGMPDRDSHASAARQGADRTMEAVRGN